MTPHPDIVPTEHRDRGEQDRRVEHLLPDAGHRRRQGLGKTRDDDRTQDAAGDPAADPKAAARDALARRQDNADDQRRFEHLAKDDDRGCQHRPLLLNHKDAASGGMEIVEKIVTPGFERADENAGRFARRDDLLAVQRGALKLGRRRLLIADDQFDLGISTVSSYM